MSKGAFFRWTDDLSVKSQEIDDQHKQLINMLNEIYQAFMDKEHEEKIGSIITKMADYAQYHFDTEEKYFIEFNYYDKGKHIMEHQDFKLKVDEFAKKYKANNRALTYDVMNFLRNWLVNHIMDSDQKYVECFTKNGVK